MSTRSWPIPLSPLGVFLIAPLLMGSPLPHCVASRAGSRPTPVPPISQNHDLQSLPLPAQAAISATLGRDNAAYHAVPHGKGLHADNQNHELAANFTPQGVQLRVGTASWSMALHGYGYGDALTPVSAVVPEANANRVEYRRGALTEWYVNGPLGLEQGFTLDAPPDPGPTGELLTLALDVSGDAQPALRTDGASLTLQQADGRPVLSYGALSAYDASGRELPVRLEIPAERQLQIRVDDAEARYPLLIDPPVRTEPGKAKLTASDGAAGEEFGGSVAISGDTVVVGRSPVSGTGSAYVFVNPGGGWFGQLTETAKLTASDAGGGGMGSAGPWRSTATRYWSGRQGMPSAATLTKAQRTFLGSRPAAGKAT